MFNVVVIGGGIFGCLCALRLSDSGFNVSIIERNNALMDGASYNNQNRLHLGFHYPRDRETAKQCIDGFYRFTKEFSKTVRGGFENAYFIANQDSQVNFEQYLAFCEELELPHRVLKPSEFPLEIRNVEGGISAPEKVYDSRLLRKEIGERLAKCGVQILTSVECESFEKVDDGYQLSLSNGQTLYANGIVNATYANQNSISQQLGFETPTRQFEYTIVPIIETSFPATGITIMDGPFMTILPFGVSEQHLLYHVRHTRVATEISQLLPPSWLDKDNNPLHRVSMEHLGRVIIDASIEFIPALKDARIVGFQHGPRMVLANQSANDARPSLLKKHSDSYLSVFSGKIDHSIHIAEQVTDHFKSYSSS